MKKAGASSVLIIALMLAVGVIAEVQEAGKVLRIGYLSVTDSSRVSQVLPALGP